MASNESKRKRSVPEWMKSPPKISPQKGCGGKGNLSHVQRVQRPSYPPISIKKRKQLPKAVNEQELEVGSPGPSNIGGIEPLDGGQDSRCTKQDRATVCDELSLYNITEKELDEFTMTVDDLTTVAKEVMKKERQENIALLQNRSLHK